MRTVRSTIREFLRGPAVSRSLEHLGVDPRRYWLLIDLFDTISDRGEMLDQLGQNGIALRIMAWVYLGLTALMAMVGIAAGVGAAAYFRMFLAVAAFFFFTPCSWRRGIVC